MGFDSVNCGQRVDPSSPGQKKGKKEPPAPSPEAIGRALADRAIALAPRPVLAIAPSRVGLTGLESYFWLEEEPRPIRAVADVAGLRVEAEARPVEYIWSFGDGIDKVTTDAGRPWKPSRPGSIAHLYERRGTYDVSVEVMWEARWRIGAGAWRHLGYFSNSDAVDYPVRQIVAVLSRPR